LCLLLALPVAAGAQQPAPPVYTFVAEWSVQRDKWLETSAFMDKSLRPIMERLVSDGTLVNFGTYETLVHQEDAETHGLWWSATSVAGIEKARLEAIKVPQPPGLLGARHHDYFLRKAVGTQRTGSGSGGYLRVASYVLQPGKGMQWREWWDKYTKPVYDALVADGTLLFYTMYVQQVATSNPSTRMVVSVAPSAEALDKAYAAFNAASEKRSAEERTAVDAAAAATVVADSTRGYLARVSAYSMK
jgi:hypothetical protein